MVPVSRLLYEGHTGLSHCADDGSLIFMASRESERDHFNLNLCSHYVSCLTIIHNCILVVVGCTLCIIFHSKGCKEYNTGISYKIVFHIEYLPVVI